MALINKIGGTFESFDDYLSGAIDGLLYAEKLPDFKDETDCKNNIIRIKFEEGKRVPLKAFINIINFLKYLDHGQLFIEPSKDGVVSVIWTDTY